MGNERDVDTVWCFDAATGAALWKYSYACELQPLSYEGGPGSTPAIAEGRVYTFSKSGDLFCFDLADGRVVWRKKFELWPWRKGDWKNTWRYAGSPLVQDDRLYLSLGEAGAAFDAADGTALWQSEAGHPGYSSPVPFRAGDVPALAFFAGMGLSARRWRTAGGCGKYLGAPSGTSTPPIRSFAAGGFRVVGQQYRLRAVRLGGKSAARGLAQQEP
jgi:hypothetical protein